MKVHHWYHVFAGGSWQEPLLEHLDALERSGLGDALASFNVGIVGPPQDRAHVRDVLEAWTILHPVPATAVAEADDGWEQVTLAPLHDWAQHNDGFVLYMHTKGASRTDPIDGPWRRDMTTHCVGEWRRCVDALTFHYTVAGAHWITDPQSPHAGMFGGNFWWTRADLLRLNTPPKTDYRHRAEEWLGDLAYVGVDVVPLDLCPHPILESHLHSAVTS